MNVIRDLSNKIREVARDHPAQAQAGDIVAHACNQLDLLAGYHELLLKSQRDGSNPSKPSVPEVLSNPKLPSAPS